MTRTRRQLGTQSSLVAWFALGALLAMGPACTHEGLVRGPVHWLEQGEEQDFTVLLRHRVDNQRAGFAEVAVDATALQSLWARWMLAGNPPPVDLERNIVVAWGERSNQQHGENFRGIGVDESGTAAVWTERLSAAPLDEASAITVVTVVAIRRLFENRARSFSLV